jgi:hypothetical protein
LSAQPIGEHAHSSSHWLDSTGTATATPPRVRIALHQTALLGMSWCDQLATAQNQQWQRIGILRKAIWKYGAATLVRSLRAHRLSASSLSWAGGFTGSLGFSFREAVEDGRQAIVEADAVSAGTVVLTPGNRAGHTFRHARRLVMDGLKYLVDDAADRGLRLAVLVAPPAKCAAWSYLAADDSALELLDEIQSPVLGLACALPRIEGHPAMVERWQRIVRRAWVVWSDSEPCSASLDARATGLNELLPRLAEWEFQGVWELRSQARRAPSTPREQRDSCRALSEALGLPNAVRPGNVSI